MKLTNGAADYTISWDTTGGITNHGEMEKLLMETKLLQI